MCFKYIRICWDFFELTKKPAAISYISIFLPVAVSVKPTAQQLHNFSKSELEWACILNTLEFVGIFLGDNFQNNVVSTLLLVLPLCTVVLNLISSTGTEEPGSAVSLFTDPLCIFFSEIVERAFKKYKNRRGFMDYRLPRALSNCKKEEKKCGQVQVSSRTGKKCEVLYDLQYVTY